MVTATKKSRAASSQRPSRALDVRVPESLEFLISEDNGGDYHWTIVAAGGATLARSGSFGSYEDAERAAQRVRDGARPVDLIARRDATSDAADAERWLDEGGSFSSEAVAKWPAPR